MSCAGKWLRHKGLCCAPSKRSLWLLLFASLAWCQKLARCDDAGPAAEAPLELSRSISRRLSGSAPEAVAHRHRAGSFFARSSPHSGSGEEEERQRLGAMLASYGLCERLVKGDGNCQARRVGMRGALCLSSVRDVSTHGVLL